MAIVHKLPFLKEKIKINYKIFKFKAKNQSLMKSRKYQFNNNKKNFH